MATWSIRLSRGAQTTVTAGPQKDMLRSIGLIFELRAPLRPCASCTVAEENLERRWMASAAGRSNFVMTWIMGVLLLLRRGGAWSGIRTMPGRPFRWQRWIP